MLLNGGVDPDTNATIIPPAEFDVITSAHSIMSPNTDGQPGLSTAVYGLGWIILSIVGHNVSEDCTFPVRNIMFANRSSRTTEVYQECQRSLLLPPMMASASLRSRMLMLSNHL